MDRRRHRGAIAALSVLAVVVLWLVYDNTRSLRVEPRDAAVGVVDVDAVDYCRDSDAERKSEANFDPYAFARAYAWEKRSGDLTAYWGCLDGFGISWKPGIVWEPLDWAPPRR